MSLRLDKKCYDYITKKAEEEHKTINQVVIDLIVEKLKNEKV